MQQRAVGANIEKLGRRTTMMLEEIGYVGTRTEKT